MPTTNLGKVSVRPCGEWSIDNTYDVLDLVTYSGGSYLSKKTVPSGTQLDNEVYWMPIAATRESVREWLDENPWAVTTVSDRSISKTKLVESVAQQIDNNTNDIQTLDDRIDTFESDTDERILVIGESVGQQGTSISNLDSRVSAIETGTTHEGDEIIGVRTGWDGTVYQSAGTAVQEQFRAVSTKTQNIWTFGDVVITPDEYSQYAIKNLHGNWPAGTYTLIVTVESDFDELSDNSAIQFRNDDVGYRATRMLFPHGRRTIYKVTTSQDATSIRFHVGEQADEGFGYSARFSNIMLIVGEYDDSTYLPPVTANDVVARAMANRAGEYAEEVMDIRVGYDDTEYDTAGEAVRSQVSAANGRIDGLQSNTQNIWSAGRTIEPKTHQSSTGEYEIGHQHIYRSYPAGTYTFISSIESDYSGDPRMAILGSDRSEILYINLKNHERTPVTFTVNQEIGGFRFLSAKTWSGSLGIYSIYSDIMLVSGTYSYSEYLPTVSAHDYVARQMIEHIQIPDDDAIPEYWESHMINKEALINKRICDAGGYGSSFAFITDIHYTLNNHNSPNLLKHIRANTPIDHLVMGGDYTASYATKPRFLAELNTVLKKYTNIMPVTNVIVGNHDLNVYNNPDDPTINLSQSEVEGFILTGQKNIIERDRTTPTFYFDDVQNRVRFFCSTISGNGQAIPESFMWIFDKLQDVPSGYTVVLLGHSAYYNSTSSQMRQWEIVQSVVSAVRSRSTITLSSYGYSGSYDYTDCDYNIAFFLCGHAHTDSVITGNGFVAIRTTCDKFQDSDGYGIERGTDTEQAFDVVTVDTNNSTVCATRIGRGYDRIVHYNPQTLTNTLTLSTTIGEATWVSDNEEIATVEDGIVTKVGTGSVIVHANGETTKEFWNIVAGS